MKARLHLLFACAAAVVANAESVFTMPQITNVSTFVVQMTNAWSISVAPTNFESVVDAAAMTNEVSVVSTNVLENAAATTNAGSVVTNAISLASTNGLLVVTNGAFTAMTGAAAVLVDTNVLVTAAQAAVTTAMAKIEEAAKANEEALRQRRVNTRTFKLQYASAEDVAEKFNSTWSGDFGLVWKVSKIAQAFPEANAVMVTAPGVILDACEQVVKVIDVEPHQVYIEARFVELANSASHRLGIDWSMLGGIQATTSFSAGADRRNIGNAVQNYSREVTTGSEKVSYGLAGNTATKTSTSGWTKNSDGTSTSSDSTTTTSTQSGRDGGVDYFTGTLSLSDMYLTLSALDASEDAKVFSNPKIIVASGKKAVVDMTEKYPNVQIASKRTLNGNSESLDLDMKMAAIPGEDKLMFAKEAFFSWGISLEVTPRVSSNGLINVSIVPTISEKSSEVTPSSGSTEGFKYPIISVQRLVTDFALAAGTTAVIGGLSKTTERQVDSGIPWLRDLPWIGDKLFGGKSREKVQKEIVVFVTVGLADPMHDLPLDVGLPKNAVLGRMYTQGQKLEPGDRVGNAIEGIAALDYRPLEEQARDPLATNTVGTTHFPLPFNPQRFQFHSREVQDEDSTEKK